MTIVPARLQQPDHPVSIALSGPDNTGKTKQIGLLARRMGAAACGGGPLDHHDPRWERVKSGGMGNWWFDSGPVQEVAEVLACSYLERSRSAASAPVRFLDRGIPMLTATVAATVAVREELVPPAAADRARALLAAGCASRPPASAGTQSTPCLIRASACWTAPAASASAAHSSSRPRSGRCIPWSEHMIGPRPPSRPADAQVSDQVRVTFRAKTLNDLKRP